MCKVGTLSGPEEDGLDEMPAPVGFRTLQRLGEPSVTGSCCSPVSWHMLYKNSQNLALGLVLYVISVNPLKERTNSLSMKFTDDTQLGRVANTKEDKEII